MTLSIPKPAKIPTYIYAGFRIHIQRIRIQHFTLNTDSGFDDQKLKKIYSCKKIKFFFDQKLQFT
jgi:hypothetical protein